MLLKKAHPWEASLSLGTNPILFKGRQQNPVCDRVCVEPQCLTLSLIQKKSQLKRNPGEENQLIEMWSETIKSVDGSRNTSYMFYKYTQGSKGKHKDGQERN